MQQAAYTHIVFDTEGSINDDGLRELATGCDVLVIPAVPATTDSDGLLYTLEKLEGLSHFRVLLNRVRHNRPKEAADLRAALSAMGIPTFSAEIPELAAFDKANAQGVPVYATDDERAAKAWEAFEAVGKEISNGRG
jgi:chromosome partitioning protein